MATPNIFLHYWNDSSASITFQEVIAWEVPTPVIEAIQIELLAQLTSERTSEAFPNFPWASPRFEEKWAGIAQTLLYQVSLPEFIWKSWIEDGSFPAAETPAEPFDLLNTEVYFEAPESLEAVSYTHLTLPTNVP
jgi:hypothetical protein